MRVLDWLKSMRCIFALYHDWERIVTEDALIHRCRRCGKTEKRMLRR
jgi:hypothetical protein